MVWYGGYFHPKPGITGRRAGNHRLLGLRLEAWPRQLRTQALGARATPLALRPKKLLKGGGAKLRTWCQIVADEKIKAHIFRSNAEAKNRKIGFELSDGLKGWRSRVAARVFANELGVLKKRHALLSREFS